MSNDRLEIYYLLLQGFINITYLICNLFIFYISYFTSVEKLKLIYCSINRSCIAELGIWLLIWPIIFQFFCYPRYVILLIALEQQTSFNFLLWKRIFLNFWGIQWVRFNFCFNIADWFCFFVDGICFRNLHILLCMLFLCKTDRFYPESIFFLFITESYLKKFFPQYMQKEYL